MIEKNLKKKWKSEGDKRDGDWGIGEGKMEEIIEWDIVRRMKVF